MIEPRDWMPGSPFQRPEWRWLWGLWLADRIGSTDSFRDGWMLPPEDTPWVLLARDYAVVQRSPTRTGSPRSQALGALIDTAVGIWDAPDPTARWQLESLLLTSAPLAEIARRLGLRTGVVDAFERLFFAVRGEAANARDWLVAQAVQCGPFNGFAGPQPGGLWRYAAFAGGRDAFEIAYAATMNQPFPAPIMARYVPTRYAEARLRFHVKLILMMMTAYTDAELAANLGMAKRARRMNESATGINDDMEVGNLIFSFASLFPAKRRRAVGEWSGGDALQQRETSAYDGGGEKAKRREQCHEAKPSTGARSK